MTYNLFYILLFTSLLHSSTSSSYSWKGFHVVRDFGAKNDGKSDSTQAFLNAWNAACATSVPSQIYVPHGDYYLKPIMFEGPCKSKILFQIDGTIHAHGIHGNHWIVFHSVNGLHIKGGVLDAKGKKLWDCKAAGHGRCPGGAQSLGFDHSKNIIVDGLVSRNSQKYHITVNACENVNMAGLMVTADADSPNTDGIHVEKSTGITVTHSQFMTGDDCISIGPNNQNLWIENIFCGPGHGISIGSLGRSKSDEGVLVQNVTIKSVTLTGTNNGLRIKTFASPIKGTVKDIYFLGATMTNVRNPIIIDQNYCPQGNCGKGQGSGIQIINVVYKGIRGVSSSQEIVTFDCSPKRPCYGLKLQDIRLYYQSKGTPKCEVKNAHLNVKGPLQPSKCLGKNY